MSYQQEEMIAKLVAENRRLHAVIAGNTAPVKGPTRYQIMDGDVVWKICPPGSDTKGWDKDPYALMAELKKGADYVAIPLEA